MASLIRRGVRRAQFIAGARAVASSLPGMAAWGLVTGIAMTKIGLALAPALGLTFVVYSGTSQLAVLPMLAGGAAVAAMVATAFVANLRFVVYSATLAPHLRRVPLPLRLATGFVTIDGPLAALMLRRRTGRLVQRVAFLNGANAATWVAWCGSSTLGIVGAAVLPFGPELGYVAVLALLGMALPLLAGRPAWAAALASAAVAIAGIDWPHRLGTAAAVAAGVVAALVAGRGARAR
ncbi:MAG: AzlC family ABC transporter permease [Rubrivivax sp.]|nr:AzlC family ABC transporter permease [Rubrivivax sp.]